MNLVYRILLGPPAILLNFGLSVFYPLDLISRTRKWIRQGGAYTLEMLNNHHPYQLLPTDESDDSMGAEFQTLSIWFAIDRNPLHFDEAVHLLENGFRTKSLKWRFIRSRLIKYYRLIASPPKTDPRLTEFFRQISERFTTIQPQGKRNPSFLRLLFSLDSSKGSSSDSETKASPTLETWELSKFVERTFTKSNLHELEGFLDSGGDIDAADSFGRTLLIHAVGNRQQEVIEMLLLRGADIEKSDRRGHTPLMQAILMNFSEIVHFLLRFKPDLEAAERNLHRTPLAASIDSGNFEVMTTLLETGADPNVADRLGMTPLILAVAMGRTEMVKHIVESGVDLDRQDISGSTALIEALLRKDRTTADFLIQSGANPEIRNHSGQSGTDLLRESPPIPPSP